MIVYQRVTQLSGVHPLGNDVTVAFGAEAGQLELNVMEPVIIYKLFSDFSEKKRESHMS